MKLFSTIVAILLFSCGLTAQNILITSQTPDGLFVCGDDTTSITITNTAGGILSGILVTVTLPNGVAYIPGSVVGASEQNLSNLSIPVFSLPGMTMASSTTISLRTSASCDLVAAINNSQLFSNMVSVTYTGAPAPEMYQSPNYIIETGYAVIVSATPIVAAGQNGEMPERQLVVRNTRLGPITRLVFTDQHFPGYSGSIAGATTENNVPVLYTAELGGAFFTGFGDGDTLLEINESVTIIEKMLIEHCGTPSFDNPSLIRVGWGCNSDICQYDSVNLSLTILPSTENPDLRFETEYGYPVDYCAGTPSTNQVRVINEGNIAAQNVFLDFYTGPFDNYTGMDPNSFEYNAGQGWMALTPSLTNSIDLLDCGQQGLTSRSAIVVPTVPANDTVLVRYRFQTCFPLCDKKLIPPYFFSFYKKNCPQEATVTDSIGFAIDSARIDIGHLVEFDLGGCMEEGASYSFNFTANSSRFTIDTSFYQIRLSLPKGIHWDDTCAPPVIEGQSPVYTNFAPDSDGGTTVVLAFQLPFTSNQIEMPFCLKFICEDSLKCVNMIGDITQEGGSSTAFPLLCPGYCGLPTQTQGSVVIAPDAAFGCGLSSCHNFLLFASAGCENSGGGGPGGPGNVDIGTVFGGLANSAKLRYSTYRINYGLKDSDDNRISDSNAPPILSEIRLDRFIPGDTLRFDLRGVVDSGVISNTILRVFTESLASDFGVNDGDFYELAPLAQTELTNIDLLSLVQAYIRVKRTDGVTYTCDAPLLDYKHKNFIELQNINVQPAEVIDQLITMYREFALNFGSCSPDGQLPSVGDSLFFVYDYTFLQNFAPPAQGGLPPALINLRNVPWDGDYAWTAPDSAGLNRPMSQYSGYQITNSFPKHTLRPCSTSMQQVPFQYQIRLARGNMFPYEVRPIAKISAFDYFIPDNAVLQSALCNMNLQEGVSWFNNVPVAWTKTGNKHSFQYGANIFNNPLDEGFNMNTNFLFDPSCTVSGADTSRLSYDITYPYGFPDDSIINYARTDASGFINVLPHLSTNFAQTILSQSAAGFEIDFLLQNQTAVQATNAWMYVEPLNGNLTDVQLIQLPQQTALPGVANLFQMGNIPLFATRSLRLKGTNTNCESLKVRLIFGWDCSPVTSPATSSCGRDTVVIDLGLQTAVLELNVSFQPDAVPLCEPSDYFIFEVSNADEGNALGVTSSIKLPTGLSVVANSSQVLYPSPGGTWVNIPDPQEASGNLFLWNFADFLPTLTEGLPGFSPALDYAYQIRFKVIAGCGFVANAQPIYGVSGVQPCGTFANSLLKPDEPLGLEGVNPAYSVDINLSPVSQGSITCGQELEIAAQLLLQGDPATGDSIYISLPEGVSFVTGSYSGVQNAPIGPPQLFGATLQLPLPPGMAQGQVIKFNFKVKYDDPAGCQDKYIIAQTRQPANGFCALTNQTCTVYIATGEALLQIPSANPDLKLLDFQLMNTVNGFMASTAVLNAGPAAANGLVVQIWLDQNGNGVPDNADVLINTLQASSLFAAQEEVLLSGMLNITPEQICQLLAVIPATENCACAPRYYPITDVLLDEGLYARCVVEPVTFGIPPVAGHSYSWEPTGLLSCSNCPQPTFTPGPGVQNGDAFIFILSETAGMCTVKHRFEIRFGEPLGISTPDQQLCKGEIARLDATPGGTYQWSGPGVISNAAIQYVSPDVTTTYSVTVTLSAGCTGTDMVTVTVLDPVSIDLGVIKTCQGTPAIIFGEPQTAAAEYCKTFTRQNGCDSVVCVTLQVIPTGGNSAISICEGDSVAVFTGQFEHITGNYCKTFTNSAGCDSTHCVALTVLPPIVPPQIDSVIIVSGDTVQLQGPAGYAVYEWSPAEGLSCTNCQSPYASPENTLNYTLTARNSAGCEVVIVYRVVVFPPCFEQIHIPNAFTPDGNGKNDIFELVQPGRSGFEKAIRLQVYNRWGQRIYDSSTNPTWDGNLGGKPAPPDVYIFILDVECNGEVRRLPQREVTLFR